MLIEPDSGLVTPPASDDGRSDSICLASATGRTTAGYSPYSPNHSHLESRPLSGDGDILMIASSPVSDWGASGSSPMTWR